MNKYLFKKQVNLSRKCNNQRPQTDPKYSVTQNTTATRQQVHLLKLNNQLSLPQQDDCKTRKDYIAKQGQTQTTHKQWEQQWTMNPQQQDPRLRPDNSWSQLGT